MERDDKKVVSRLILISGFTMLAGWACGAFKLCYVAYKAHGIYLGAFFTLLSGLLFVYSAKLTLKKAKEAAEESKDDKQGSKD